MKNDRYKNLKIPSLSIVVQKLLPNLQSKKSTHTFNVLIFGFFGMRNIGDDAILLAEINELSKLGVPLSIVVPSQNPEIIESTYNVKSIPNKNILLTLSEIFTSQLIIFGGGGLICKAKKNLSLNARIFDDLFTIYKCLVYFIVPKLLGKKIIVFGIGAYPNINWLQKISYTMVLNLADYISVRDKVSFEFLSKRVSFPIHYQKDVAFLLDDLTYSKEEKQKLEKNILLRKSKINIGISLISTNDSKLDGIIREVVSQVLNKYNNDCNYYFFPFYTEPNQENDLVIAEKLQKKLGKSVNLNIIPSNVGAQGFLYLFGKLDGALSMRFHSQVFAYKNNLNFLGISYDEKCKSFLEEIKMYYSETNNFDPKKFQLQFDNYLSTLLAKN